MYGYQKGRTAIPALAKRPRKKEKEAPPLTAPQQIIALTAEIDSLEKEIAARVEEFKSVRVQMLAGITSFQGTQVKEKIEELTAKLGRLKVARSEAFVRVDEICGDASSKQRKEYNPSAYVTEGGCPGGCYEGNLSYWQEGCVDTCTACGSVYPRLDNSMEGVNFADLKFMDFPRRRSGGYKPPNHYAEIISQFQGKRRASAPQDVVDVVADYCKRYGFEKHKITPQIVRMFLKQKQQEETTFRKYSKVKPAMTPGTPVRKYTDYYKHCPEIAWRLSGIPPPYMTPSQEDRIIALFPLVVEAYKTSPRYLKRKADRTNRKKANPNLLNYCYVLFKLAQLLGYDEFLPYIALPKSTANIDENDEAGWKHICDVNGWQYIPTR
jgi:hypothetical protein